MDVSEISTRSALVNSKIPGVAYVINPFLGCAHGCRYCYAVFMRKYSRHHQTSPVCDPYQPMEHRYRVTRRCLEALSECGWGIDILTKSPLVTRDLDILATTPDVSVGLSIPTDDDRVRAVLEPNSPPIGARLTALEKLHAAGIQTWVFIAPILPMNATRLYESIEPYITHLMVDPLNYRNQVKDIFLKNYWDYELTDLYASETRTVLLRLWNQRAKRH